MSRALLAAVEARRFEQLEGADEVGRDEGPGPVDGAVDVGFRREVHDRSRAVDAQEVPHPHPIPDVGLDEGEPLVLFHVGQALAVARVGELVHRDDVILGGGEEVPHEVAADETRGSGDERLLLIHAEP
jgi:hypothetical protein